MKRRGGSPSYPILTDDLTVMIEQDVSDLDLSANLSAEGRGIEGISEFHRRKKPSVRIAFADAAAFGFDKFGDMVKSGDFDRLLLRPRSTALQLAGQELMLRRVGRLAQGLAILLWASAFLDFGWGPDKVVCSLAPSRAVRPSSWASSCWGPR